MYKYEKETERESQQNLPEYMYAEKTGVYCDLCGKLIDSGETDLKVRFSYPRFNHSLSPHTRADEFEAKLPIERIIPVIQFKTIFNQRKLDLCDDCESELVDKVLKHSYKVIHDLETVSRRDILYHLEDIENDKDQLQRLREVNDAFRDGLEAYNR